MNPGSNGDVISSEASNVLISGSKSISATVQRMRSMTESFIMVSAICDMLCAMRNYNGMFPCFFGGFVSRLFCNISSAAISFGRVSCGSITSSM